MLVIIQFHSKTHGPYNIKNVFGQMDKETNNEKKQKQ
jgi:hypothetical protein